MCAEHRVAYRIARNRTLRRMLRNPPLWFGSQNRFGDSLGEDVWEACNAVFDRMPLAAVIDRDIFCVHGGIPRPLEDSTSRIQVRTLTDGFCVYLKYSYGITEPGYAAWIKRCEAHSSRYMLGVMQGS